MSAERDLEAVPAGNWTPSGRWFAATALVFMAAFAAIGAVETGDSGGFVLLALALVICGAAGWVARDLRALLLGALPALIAVPFGYSTPAEGEGAPIAIAVVFAMPLFVTAIGLGIGIARRNFVLVGVVAAAVLGVAAAVFLIVSDGDDGYHDPMRVEQMYLSQMMRAHVRHSPADRGVGCRSRTKSGIGMWDCAVRRKGWTRGAEPRRSFPITINAAGRVSTEGGEHVPAFSDCCVPLRD